MCKWEKGERLPENVCPKKFCFLWSEELNKCSETFGPCKRLFPNENFKDWYEPCEPELERNGLPRLYYINNDSSMEIQIEGCVDVSENPLSVDDFYNKFIEWIESNGWYFGGGINSFMQD
jgi:hypothetical protein